MEVHTVSNHMNSALLSPTKINSKTTTPKATRSEKIRKPKSATPPPSQQLKQSQESPKVNEESIQIQHQKILTANNIQILNNLTNTDSRSNSPASIHSNPDQVDKTLRELDLNSSLNSGSVSLDIEHKSNGSLSGASNSSAKALHKTNGTEDVSGSSNPDLNGSGNVDIVNNLSTSTTNSTGSKAEIKKRISSSRTPTRKAKRIKFYRNGDRFYPGITIPVSNERYRSFESLFEDLTRLLEENVKIPGAVRTIFTMCGKKISSLEELEDGQSYICSCNNECFKKVEYNLTSQPLANLIVSNKANNRISKLYRPSSPMKNGSANNTVNNGSPVIMRLSERDRVVSPRIVTLIRNGTKPRRIMRLLLNKRNSPSFEHVLTAITQVVKLDTGYVRKVFTQSGNPVLQLADFFGAEDVFFAYGTERVNHPDDLKLEQEEQRAIQAIRKTDRTTTCSSIGPKPKMPVKSKNLRKCVISEQEDASQELALLNDAGIDVGELPLAIRERYVLGRIIGDGNFAIVLKVKERATGLHYALKIIDKSKCRGKEHYIDAEVRVMKKLNHPYINTLIMDVDQPNNMFLVLEYVSGGDLFDAISRVTRFSEDEARVMIRHLASAMSYLHSMSIVHRDIKPENLLVKLDSKGNVVELKLADFGLACEVTEPLYAVCGTPTYVAPEILMELGYGLKIDVWAAGVILYILLCGFPPFVAPDQQQEPLFDAIIKGAYEFPDPYWSDISDGVRDLIVNMLQSEPEIRFTSEDILDHYWTMDIDLLESGDYNS